MTTPILGMQELIASQTQPHIPVNTNFRVLEVYGQISVIDIQNDPDGVPVEGDAYIVGLSPTGEWIGHENEIAAQIGGGWVYLAPKAGWIAYNQAEGKVYVYSVEVSPDGWEYLVGGGIPLIFAVDDVMLASYHNGSKIVIPAAAATAGLTVTVPNNSTDPLSLDHTTTIINLDTNPVTIEMEDASPITDYLYLSPGGTSVSRSLGQYGIATITKVGDTEWIIMGSELT